MPQTLQDILAQLDPVYNPQKSLIQKQIDELPGQQQAEQAGLEQEKTNAFGDINVQANDRGLSYSGMPIAEQAKYVGTKYLPAVAALKTNYANRGTSLQQSLLGLQADEMKSAQGTYADEVKAERDAAAKVEAARIAAASRAATARPAAAPKDPYSVTRDKSGGYQFAGPGGQPVTAAQYYAAHGGSWQDVFDFVQNSSSNAQLKSDLTRLTPQQLTQKYPYIFGGV